MMTKGWKYNPTGFVCDRNADTVCRIAARSDQDEIGAAIEQVPAMMALLSRLVDYGHMHDPILVENARMILRDIQEYRP